MASVPSTHLAGASPPPTIALPPLPPSVTNKPLPSQPQPSVSRYRSLRGKSVSTPKLREFDVYSDSEETNVRDAARKKAQLESPSVRRRSRSVTAAVGQLNLNVSKTRPAAPLSTNAASPLSSRPLNLPSSTLNVHLENDSADTTSTGEDENSLQPPPRPPQFRSVSHNSPFSNKTASVSVVDLAGDQQTPRNPPPVRESVFYAPEVARLEAENARILDEQKKLDLARLQAQLAAAASPPPKTAKRQQILGKLGLLGRTKWSPARSVGSPGSPNSLNWPSTPKSTREYRSLGSASARGPPRTPQSAGLVRPRTAVEEHENEKGWSTSPEGSPAMAFIQPGGRGIVPQTDAPTSASNAGERRVTVRCLSSTINLPVTNDTSPTDIVFSSANFTTHQIDPASSIVIECYTTLGLERRLRKYERIRDVMNSWDRDAQNSLMIHPLESSDESVANLEIASVKRGSDSPPGFLIHIYHSSRPGKWNKRWVTLAEGGQMFASKKPDGKPTDKDSVSLCHLSDFDIYTPRESTMRRTLKPPKRFCYAIKSQQKTIVFSNNTENFVHFFSTEDPELAKNFHAAVHAWRSWYLVNKQVDLQKKDRNPTSPRSKQSGQMSRSGTQKTHRKGQLSLDSVSGENPYMIGDFKPLMDMQHFDEPLEDFGKTLEQEAKAVQERVRAEQKQTAEAQRAKALEKTMQSRPAVPLVSTKAPEEFSSGGLLGDGYEKRKASNGTSAAPGATSPQMSDGPFTNGDSLLAQAAKTTTSPTAKAQAPEERSWFPSATEHTARSRSQSRSQSVKRPSTSSGRPAQPLIDLRKDPLPTRPGVKSGQGLKTPSGAPLVNYATGHQAPPNHVFSNAEPPKRGINRSQTAGSSGLPQSGSNRSMGSSTRMGSSGQPPLPSGHRPRAKSSASQGGAPGSKGPLLQGVGAPPVPSLPHRSGRREMPRGRPGAPGGPTEPLVNLAR